MGTLRCAVFLAVSVTLAATFGAFSGWLTSTPGQPASPGDRAAFQAVNAHTFAAAHMEPRTGG